jgi:hypothetical protein
LTKCLCLARKWGEGDVEAGVGERCACHDDNASC